MRKDPWFEIPDIGHKLLSRLVNSEANMWGVWVLKAPQPLTAYLWHATAAIGEEEDNFKSSLQRKGDLSRRRVWILWIIE